MADRIIQLKDKDGDKVYPIAVTGDKFITYKDAEGTPPTIGEDDVRPIYIQDGEVTAFTSTLEEIHEGLHQIAQTSGTAADDCVFNFESTTQPRALKSKLFYGQMTDPIANSAIYGYIETVQHYFSGQYTYIVQTFTKTYLSGDYNIVFKRKGYISPTLDVYDEKSNITWLDWYPVEYPASQTGLTASAGTVGNSHWEISGGILKINIRDCMVSSASSTVTTLLTIPSWMITLSKTYTSAGTIQCGMIADLAGNVLHAQTYQGDNSIKVYGTIIPGTYYYGNIVIPMGY